MPREGPHQQVVRETPGIEAVPEPDATVLAIANRLENVADRAVVAGLAISVPRYRELVKFALRESANGFLNEKELRKRAHQMGIVLHD